MTMESVAITTSIVTTIMSLSALVIGHFESRKPLPGRNIVITFDDPVEGSIHVVVHSTRRIDQIVADMKRAIREGFEPHPVG